MTASSCDYYALDRGAAFSAGLAFTAVNAVFQLEEPFLTFLIYVIGNAGSAEANGFL